MIYSKTCEYAIRSLHFLARYKSRKFVRTETMSRATGIPPGYLPKILHELVRYGILESKRGAKGGVALRVDPKTISIRTIMDIVDDPGHLKSCVMGLDRCSDQNPCPLHVVWSAAKQKMLSEMEEKSIALITKEIGKKRFSETHRGRLNRDLSFCEAAG